MPASGTLFRGAAWTDETRRLRAPSGSSVHDGISSSSKNPVASQRITS
ncbi:hypothetical protein HMPREF1861_00574 [Corynebacterium kroppenstedtii]|nr:hypothetical protein HMPREF1861_00574 [Corynebacterium kroppenstedtii]